MSQKFEKWSKKGKSIFVRNFSEHYNKENNTDFKVTEDSFVEDQDYDFILFNDKSGTLKIQHTLATAPPQEHILPNKSFNIVHTIQKYLEKYTPPRGLSVSLNFYNFPSGKNSKEETAIIVRDLILLIKKSFNETRDFIFKYNKEEQEDLVILQKYISEIEIQKSDSTGITYGYSWNSGKTLAILGDDQRFEMSLQKKSNKYSNPEDLILIVDFRFPSFGISDFYINIIKSKYPDGSSFKEVWSYDGYREFFYKIL